MRMACVVLTITMPSLPCFGYVSAISKLGGEPASVLKLVRRHQIGGLMMTMGDFWPFWRKDFYPQLCWERICLQQHVIPRNTACQAFRSAQQQPPGSRMRKSTIASASFHLENPLSMHRSHLETEYLDPVVGGGCWVICHIRWNQDWQPTRCHLWCCRLLPCQYDRCQQG